MTSRPQSALLTGRFVANCGPDLLDDFGLVSAWLDSGRSIPVRSALNYSRSMVKQRLKMRLLGMGQLRPIRYIRDCEQADAAAHAR